MLSYLRNPDRTVPWLRPTELRDCGAAAFASVAAAAGHHVSVEEARDLVGTDNNGTHLIGLVRGGRLIGLESQAAMSDFGGLRDVDGWIVLHLDPGEGHFVVVLRWTPRGLWVMDPNRGRTFLPRAVYEEDASRYLVVFRPSAALQPRLSPIEPWRTARRIVSCELWRQLATVGCGAAGAGLLLASPLVLGRVFDRVLPRGDSGLLSVLASALVGLGLLQAIFLLCRVAGESWVQRRLARSVGEQMLRHFARLPQSVYDTRCTAGFVLRTMTANEVARGLGPSLVALWVDAGVSCFALGLVVTHDLLVGLAVASALPVSWGIWHLTHHRSSNAQHRVWMATERFMSRTVDTFVELRSVRLAGSTERFVESLVDDFDFLVESQRRQRVAQSLPAVLSTFLFASLSGAVLWWLASRVLAGQATAGDLVVVVGTVTLFLGPAQQFPSHLASLSLAIDSVRRVEEVLQRAPEADEGAAEPGWIADGRVEFAGVSFGHQGRSQALVDVSLVVEPGEVVAFVGETGAGKTSIANLVCGFYEVDSGDLRVDGRSRCDVALVDWRRQVAAVFQDSGLIQRSVGDNVAMLHDVDPQLVIDALRTAQAHDFVAQLRNGLDSQVALGGDNFSAGQAQRVALARAVVRDTPILVLDEATCNLDSETERAVMDAILDRRRGRTTLIFGHRLSALRGATRIVVLASGRIVESGSLADLIERNGEFVRLFRAQLDNAHWSVSGAR